MNIRALVIAGMIVLGISLSANAQYAIQKSVIGCGFTLGQTTISGNTIALDGTLGQAVIGPAQGSGSPPFLADQGFWYTIPAGNSVKEGPPEAAGFDLEQNYPNPFNPSTTIKYSVGERSHVTVRVMNLLGQEVHAPLVDEVDEPGTYQIDFTDADNLPSGTYIYRMDAGNFSASKRMVLLK